MSLHLKIALITLFVSLAACATNNELDVSEQGTESASVLQGDITRPPVFVKRDTEITENDPEETISLEEWQKEQEEGE